MNRFEFYSNAHDYELSHSSVFDRAKGYFHKNHLYYKRIGNPNNYKYFYTEDEYNKYMKSTPHSYAKEEAARKYVPVNTKTYEENIKSKEDAIKEGQKSAFDQIYKNMQQKYFDANDKYDDTLNSIIDKYIDKDASLFKQRDQANELIDKVYETHLNNTDNPDNVEIEITVGDYRLKEWNATCHKYDDAIRKYAKRQQEISNEIYKLNEKMNETTDEKELEKYKKEVSKLSDEYWVMDKYYKYYLWQKRIIEDEYLVKIMNQTKFD